jgi:pimeloyl-ACP methyl ester carboxylesterase
MNRNLYLFGMFLLGLSAASGLFEGIALFKLEQEILKLQSLPGWSVLGAVVLLAATLVLLKYYLYKKYWITFSSALLNSIAHLFYFIVIYRLLLGEGLRPYYMQAYMVFLGTGMVYALSLLFSNAGKRFWLKLAGVFLLIQGIILGLTLIGNMYNQDVQTYRILRQIHVWTSLAGNFIPLLFILNFKRELKAEKAHLRFQKALNVFFVCAGAVVLILTLIFGQKLAYERFWILETALEKLTADEKRAARPYEARIFVNKSGEKLQYRLHKPMDYDSTKTKYPLVINLHGGGGRGSDNFKQIYHSVLSRLLENGQFGRDHPAFIFVPQCPEEASWGGTPYGPVVDSLVFEAILALEKEFTIDKKRRYVVGASMGGYGAWHFIASRPHFFAAAVPICGVGDPQNAQKIAEVPIWAFHGKLDKLVPVSGSREMIAAIKKAGGSPRYTEFPDKGHDLWTDLTATPELLNWLFEQKRE